LYAKLQIFYDIIANSIKKLIKFGYFSIQIYKLYRFQNKKTINHAFEKHF